MRVILLEPNIIFGEGSRPENAQEGNFVRKSSNLYIYLSILSFIHYHRILDHNYHAPSSNRQV